MPVREATLTDADGIAQVDVESHAMAYAQILPAHYLAENSLDVSTATWRRILGGQGRPDRAPTKVFVAVDGEEVVGYIGLNGSRDRDGQGVGEIGAIYVSPQRWRQGIGHLLMRSGIEWLTERGFREATLWVLQANQQARSFYEKEDWHPDGASRTQERGGVETVEVRYRCQLPDAGALSASQR